MSGAPVVVYVHGSFIERLNGSHARFIDLLDWAAATFGEVVLYSYRDHPTIPWQDSSIAAFKARFPSVRLVLEERSKAVKLATRVKLALLQLLPLRAEAILQYRLAGQTPQFDALTAGAHVLIPNFVDGLAQLNGIGSSRTILETHDVKFAKFAQRSGAAFAGWRVVGKFRSEVASLSCLRAVVGISPSDVGFFRTVLPGSEVFYIPNYRPPPAARAEADTGPAERVYDLLFVGARNNFNIEGLTGFLAENRSRLGALRIAVAGGVCDDPGVIAEAKACPGVELLGFVDDLPALFARSKLAISPVEGTGLKIKVLEALQNGVPVLASRHSMDALPPGSEGCVFPLTPAELDRLLSNPDQLEAARAETRRYVRKMFEAGDLAGLESAIRQGLAEGS